MSVWYAILALCSSIFFFFNDTATTEIYTLSLHDALPIFLERLAAAGALGGAVVSIDAIACNPTIAASIVENGADYVLAVKEDRKSTRLNSSHANISYAVFCLKKKKTSRTSFGTRQKCDLL